MCSTCPHVLIIAFVHFDPRSALSMIFAAKMVNHVTRNHDRPEIVRTSKFLALRWHVAFFALLCMSLAM